MQKLILFLAFLLPGLAPAQEATNVRVEYVGAEKFTDLGNHRFSSERVRAAYLEELRAHLVARIAPRLAAGQQVVVSVTDVDMAGEFEPSRPSTRVIRDLYAPRIDLAFRVTSGGAFVREGERKLRDQMFVAQAATYGEDPLRYEKALLDRWVEREFGASKIAG